MWGEEEGGTTVEGRQLLSTIVSITCRPTPLRPPHHQTHAKATSHARLSLSSVGFGCFTVVLACDVSVPLTAPREGAEMDVPIGSRDRNLPKQLAFLEEAAVIGREIAVTRGNRFHLPRLHRHTLRGDPSQALQRPDQMASPLHPYPCSRQHTPADSRYSFVSAYARGKVRTLVLGTCSRGTLLLLMVVTKMEVTTSKMSTIVDLWYEGDDMVSH